MAQIDNTYYGLLNEILDKGFTYEDLNRKGINRIQIQDYRFEHSFKDGFPAITTKKLAWKSVVGELIWFLRGDTNIKYLVENNINIWNKDAYNYYLATRNSPLKINYEDFLSKVKNKEYCNSIPNNEFGSVGRIYGAQWRRWDNGYSGKSFMDQIIHLITGLKKNTMGTRHIVTAWNPAELDDMALPPCHWAFEILVRPVSKMKKKLMLSTIKSPEDIEKIPMHEFTLKWHQRSVDTFLGLPFNIASYALLAQIIGKMTNMIPMKIIGDLSNVHIYETHLDSVKKQLKNNPDKYGLCTLNISDTANLIFKKFRGYTNGIGSPDFGYYNNVTNVMNGINIQDFTLKGYESYPPIKAEMLVYNK